MCLFVSCNGGNTICEFELKITKKSSKKANIKWKLRKKNWYLMNEWKYLFYYYKNKFKYKIISEINLYLK